jgi:hypothetical protein
VTNIVAHRTEMPFQARPQLVGSPRPTCCYSGTISVKFWFFWFQPRRTLACLVLSFRLEDRASSDGQDPKGRNRALRALCVASCACMCSPISAGRLCMVHQAPKWVGSPSFPVCMSFPKLDPTYASRITLSVAHLQLDDTARRLDRSRKLLQLLLISEKALA